MPKMTPPYDKDATYKAIVERNNEFEKFLKETYTDEERQKMIDDNFMGADQ